jgi:hypothetical protein
MRNLAPGVLTGGVEWNWFSHPLATTNRDQAEPPRPQPGVLMQWALFALVAAPTMAVAQPDTTSAGYLLPHCQARHFSIVGKVLRRPLAA